jgi:hypothetical protein
LGKLIDLDDEEIVNPIDPQVNTQEKIQHLAALSKDNEPKVLAFLKQIDAKYGTTSKTSHKEADKIAEKARRPAITEVKPWHDVEHIRDSFRFKTVLKDLEDLPRIAEDLKEAGFEVIKTDTDKVLRPGFWGWRIAAFDLRMPNGQLVEYYLPVQEMEAAKKNGNHELFEKWRNEDVQALTPKQEAEYLDDTDTSKEKYDTAWRQYLDRTKQKPERVKEILDSVERVFEKTKPFVTKKVSSSALRKQIRGRIRDAKLKSKDDDLMR